MIVLDPSAAYAPFFLVIVRVIDDQIAKNLQMAEFDEKRLEVTEPVLAEQLPSKGVSTFW